MILITLEEYNKTHRDYRGVWETERWDWPDWEDVRQQYMGKRTLMRDGGLIIEDMHFIIAD